MPWFSRPSWIRYSRFHEQRYRNIDWTQGKSSASRIWQFGEWVFEKGTGTNSGKCKLQTYIMRLHESYLPRVQERFDSCHPQSVSNGFFSSHSVKKGLCQIVSSPSVGAPIGSDSFSFLLLLLYMHLMYLIRVYMPRVSLYFLFNSHLEMTIWEVPPWSFMWDFTAYFSCSKDK